MGKGLPRLFSAAIAAVVLCVSPCASALDVYFAGFATLGDANSIASNFPHSTALNLRQGGEPGALDREIFRRMRALEPRNFTLKFDELGSLGPEAASTTALAFVLDREDVTVEPLAGGYKIVAQLSAQALFFDFREGAVIASYPFTTQYIDHVSRSVTDGDLRQLLGNMYLAAQQANVFDDFEKVLAASAPSREVTRRVQVRLVDIGEGALAHAPANLANDPRRLKSALGQDFSKFLSLNQRIAVLPYTLDYAIANRMAGRFADGSVFDLKIPEPDYEINLVLENLKKIEYQRTAAGASYVYGAYLRVTAAEPLSNTIYLDATIKNGATKIVPASMREVDDWAAFQETLLVLMNKFTEALNEPRADWAKTHADKPGVINEMKKLQKVLQSCR